MTEHFKVRTFHGHPDLVAQLSLDANVIDVTEDENHVSISLTKDEVASLVSALKRASQTVELEKVESERIDREKNDPKHWAIIQSLGWGRSYDYNRMSDQLCNSLSREESKALRCFVNRLMNQLYETFRVWEEKTNNRLDCGDDSWSDLRAHVIGLGEEEFTAALREPQRLVDRYEAEYGSREGYRESFMHALPYDSDYN